MEGPAVNARKEAMDLRRDMRTKSLSEEDGKAIQLMEDMDVSSASIKCFLPSLRLGQMKNCDKYLYIGHCDEYEVKPRNNEHHKQTTDSVNLGLLLYDKIKTGTLSVLGIELLEWQS